MVIEITARHMHDAEGVQDYARRKSEEMGEEFPSVEHVHVVLSIEKHRNTATVVVQARGHVRLEADETSSDMYASVDEAFEKIVRQLRRLRDKVQDHKAVMRQHEQDRENQ